MISKSICRLVTLVVILSASYGTNAHCDDARGNVGIGLSASGGGVSFPFRIWASEKFTVEPAIGITFASPPTGDDEWLFNFGLGFMSHGMAGNSVHPFGGLRFSTAILSVGGNTAIDFFLAPVVGAEYYMSKRFSISGEFQLVIGFTDEDFAATPGLTRSTQFFTTQQRLMVFFYL